MLLLIQIYYLIIFFRWWSQIKTAGSAIYANRHYLQLYHKQKQERLAVSGPDKPTIVGDVYIHPSATVDSTAVVSGHSAYYRSGVFKLWPTGHIQPATFFSFSSQTIFKSHINSSFTNRSHSKLKCAIFLACFD